MRIHRVVICGLCAVSLVACGEKKEETEEEASGACDDSSSLALVNGHETTEYSAVGLIIMDNKAACTGTFVSATTMITAAHCVNTSENGGIIYIPGAKPNFQDPNLVYVEALKVVHLGKTSDDFVASDSPSAELRLSDLAVVIFPPATAPAVVGLTSRRPGADDVVTMVGYGLTQLIDQIDDTPHDPSRVVGTNKIEDAPNDPAFEPSQLHLGFVTEAESVDADGAAAMVSKGDSGGPILLDGALAGIASQAGATVSSPVVYHGVYNDAIGAKALELYAAARAEGAVIPEPGDEPATEELGTYEEQSESGSGVGTVNSCQGK